ncbi:MAG: hypothetical protein ACR2GR_11050 [Rhodothermales bacterium]
MNEVLPRLLVNPFVFSLWALYERLIIDLAELIRDEKQASLALGDIKGKYLIDRIEKYFTYVLDFPLGYTEELKSKLSLLGQLRNAIAHGNGRSSTLNKKLAGRVRQGEIAGLSRSEYGDLILVDLDYAKEAFEVVRTHLRLLIRHYNDLGGEDL